MRSTAQVLETPECFAQFMGKDSAKYSATGGWVDRTSNDVLALTAQVPMTMQEFVRKNAGAFTAAAKTKEAPVFADARI